MRRSTLSRFFQSLLVASLPLAAACHDNTQPPAPDSGLAELDLAMVLPIDMALPAPDLYDKCEIDFPVTRVNTDPSNLPDGGFHGLCQLGAVCTAICPPGYMQCCAPTPSDGGAIIVDCSLPCLGGGRRPDGLTPAVATSPSDGRAVGDYFAAMAHLEAASVTAFRRLGRELRAHGAPASLVASTRRALSDEVRHARTLSAFAARHGCAPPPLRVARARPRPLEAMARENAVEGCVRETFGALVASWQARTAADRRFAAAMSSIAGDETRHAELSWSVAAFCRSQLPPAANRRIRRARQAAVDELAAELEQGWPAPIATQVGLPDRARTRQLFDATRRALWS